MQCLWRVNQDDGYCCAHLSDFFPSINPPVRTKQSTYDQAVDIDEYIKGRILDFTQCFLKASDINASGSTDILIRDENRLNTIFHWYVTINSIQVLRDSLVYLRHNNNKNHNRISLASLINISGQTPLDLARNADVETQRVLALYEAELIDGTTTLHIAAREGWARLTELLIAEGDEVNILTTDGQTPLHFAERNQHTDVANILTQNGADPTLEDDDGKTPQMLFF